MYERETSMERDLSMATINSSSSGSRYAMYLRPALVMATLATSAFVANAASKDAPSAPEVAANKAEVAVSDSWITTKVKSEILANSVSKAFKVGVTTKHGVVSLDGKLPTKDAVDLVKMIAEKVKGVKSVDASRLTIAG